MDNDTDSSDNRGSTVFESRSSYVFRILQVIFGIEYYNIEYVDFIFINLIIIVDSTPSKKETRGR